MIHLETFSDHLQYHAISKDEACKLFGRTRKTLNVWENDPPEWALRIIQLMGKKPPFPVNWEGWYFEKDFICDPAGNKYHQNEVKSSLYTERANKLITGDNMTITSLKMELEKKIAELNNDVVITVELGGLKRHFDISLKKDKIYSFK